jgi:DNA-binding CsgD family transcriptional regulator
MRALRATDLAEVAELAESGEVIDFEAGLLELLRRHVGFDVALFRRKLGYGQVSVGFDPGLLRSVAPHWPEFVAEWGRTGGLLRLERQRGVTTDLESYGEQGFQRLSAYQRLAKPAGEIRCASVCSVWQGRTVAHLLLGRARRGRFHERELERLRAFSPAIRLAESLLYVQSKCRELAPPVESQQPAAADVALTPRERQVASYLELGYSNEQIATACGTSLYTVRNQLSRAYAKLGVATRAEAVSALLRQSR